MLAERLVDCASLDTVPMVLREVVLVLLGSGETLSASSVTVKRGVDLGVFAKLVSGFLKFWLWQLVS